MSKPALLWHTVQHLKFTQIWYRLLYQLPARIPAHPDSCLPNPAHGRWVRNQRSASMLAPNRFEFLNRERELRSSDDWQRSDLPLLWTYNLHYFDDLNAEDAEQRSSWHHALISRWIAENPPALGAGWHPYPLSLRIVNWMKWSLSGNSLDAPGLRSLAQQASHLNSRLEFHLLGNHLWANAKALVFAGCFFSGKDVDEWRRQGLLLIEQQLREQVLSDGGHFERSPMYHAIILEDLLDLVQLSIRYPGAIARETGSDWRKHVVAMFRWLACMSHPDGEISFFNDAAIGIASNLKNLSNYAETLGVQEFDSTADTSDSLVHLKPTGFIRAVTDNACLLVDAGDVGPAYQPGHAHAETLSFELSLFGHRLIVNNGIDRYGTCEERLRQRGTAAHSTVEIDGQNSSQVWSGFRVARRARVFDVQAEQTASEIFIRGSHDGYRWRKSKTVHSREWRLTPASLRVADQIHGSYKVALARYHLHPFVRVLHWDETGCQLQSDTCVIDCRVDGGSLAVVDSDYHPEFGLTIPTKCLVVSIVGGHCEFTMQWSS